MWGEGWVPACARTTEGEGVGSVEEASSAVGFVEGTRHSTAKRPVECR